MAMIHYEVAESGESLDMHESCMRNSTENIGMSRRISFFGGCVISHVSQAQGERKQVSLAILCKGVRERNARNVAANWALRSPSSAAANWALRTPSSAAVKGHGHGRRWSAARWPLPAGGG